MVREQAKTEQGATLGVGLRHPINLKRVAALPDRIPNAEQRMATTLVPFPLHVPLEVNLCTLEHDSTWRGVSMFALRDLLRREGVMNQVYLSRSAFWIIHREAIETVYDLALRFWHKAKEAGLLVDVSAALGYAMQILCADPEKHLLANAPELWASDDGGYFNDRPPDSVPWQWQHPLATEGVQVRPAIIHLARHSKVRNASWPVES